MIVDDFKIDINVNSHRIKELLYYMQSQKLQEITHCYRSKTKSEIDHISTNSSGLHCDINVLDSYWIEHDAVCVMLEFE